jgi:hypothetical protein
MRSAGACGPMLQEALPSPAGRDPVNCRLTMELDAKR